MQCNKYVLNDDGHPVSEPDLMRWAAWMGKKDGQRIVARTTVAPGVEVSTVFLGLDHSFRPGGEPVLWETMVFAAGHSLDQEMDRYTSLAAAKAGHEAMVERVRSVTKGD